MKQKEESIDTGVELEMLELEVPINLKDIVLTIDHETDLTVIGMRKDISHQGEEMTPLLKPLLGIETSKVTAHIHEVRLHLRVYGVRVPRLVPHGGIHLSGKQKDTEIHLRILIRV